MKKILLNGKEHHFSDTSLPLLIHAHDGSGGSMFSISAVADLYSQGSKILFLCGFHMARDEFVQQTGATDTIHVEKQSDIQSAINKQVIFVSKETPELFTELVRLLPDIDQRVIFFKNFDLLDKSVFESISSMKKLLLMGDLDKCSYSKTILDKSWAEVIYFSTSKEPAGFVLPDLPKYTGYLHSQPQTGLISLD